MTDVPDDPLLDHDGLGLAAPGADEMLYALAFQLETARPWTGRWAPTSAKYL
jgi:hypothetical protein